MPANKEQLEAINTTEGPVLIIAGPGAGKTFTLVERTFRLLSEMKIEPEHIFVSTFTEKASRELVTRISDRIYEADLNININNLCVGTLHSIFLNLLEEFRDFTRLKRNYSLWDQFDQQYAIYKHIHEFIAIDPDCKVFGKGSWWNIAGEIAKQVNKVSEEALDVETLKSSDDEAIQKLAIAYEAYKELLEEENALDFSMIQKEFYDLLLREPTVLETLRQRFEYFMIDEYQDTNSIQERILLLLLNDKKNICVVGDDDQGLYRFRGATIRNILEFEQNFDGKCKRIELTKNYRSHSGIINFYNDWMKQQEWTGKSGETYIKRDKAKEGVPMHDVWDDINFIGPTSSERIGYPTQKPEALVERIIKASSNPGDLVFDCFMGSGTTQAVAMKLGRRFIGADINLGSIETTVKRLVKIQKDGNMLDDAKAGFEVYNVNNYDVFRNPVGGKLFLFSGGMYMLAINFCWLADSPP